MYLLIIVSLGRLNKRVAKLVSIWAVIIPGVTAFLGVLIPQIFVRKKNRAETHKIEAEAQAIEIETRLKKNEVIKRLSAIEKQVTNSHSTNLREDIDGVSRKMDSLSKTVEGLGETVEGLAARLNTQAIAIEALRTDNENVKNHFINEVRSLQGSIEAYHQELKDLRKGETS